MPLAVMMEVRPREYDGAVFLVGELRILRFAVLPT